LVLLLLLHGSAAVADWFCYCKVLLLLSATNLLLLHDYSLQNHGRQLLSYPDAGTDFA
jgi:hypothetical protein